MRDNMFRGHGGDVLDASDRAGLLADEIIDFSSNMNPLGPPPHLRDVIYRSVDDITSYPDVECRGLRKRLADEFEIAPESIMTGNGSTELIYLLARALGPRRAATFPPCYLDYQRASQMAGAEVAGYVRDEEHGLALDPEKIRSACDSADMLWIGNPNNPTGDLIERDVLEKIAGQFPNKIFVVDEAFVEFLEDYDSRTILSSDTPANVVIMRSLTKFFAIPGLRLGFMAASPEIVQRMERLKEPWTVNSIALAAGERLYDDRDYMERSRRYVAVERAWLMDGLMKIEGIHPLPSSACFIQCRIDRPGLTSTRLKNLALRRGVLIRDCANFKGLDARWFRVAVRTRSQNERLISALGETLNKGAAE